MKSIPLIAALLVFAATASAADKWTSVQSENFLLVGSASESHMRDVAENLELFRTAYGKFFPLQEKSATIDTTVIVFKSDAAFRPYKPLYQGKPANIAGYFQGGEDKNLIVLSADIETPRAIYHEYVHRLMSGSLSSLPPWFQEGFAECFSTLEIEGKDKKLRLGRAIPEHVALLNQRRFLPLERLFAVTADSREYNDGEKQGLFYAESWALVHYMMLGPQDRRTRFFEFLEGLKEGTPAPEAFQHVFQTDLGTFQKTFEAYIHQRLVWPAMEMTPSGRLDRNKDLTSRTLTEAEAEFYLGDMLLHDDRLAAAEPHLLSALRLDPSLAVAHVGMGKLRLRQNRDLEARTYLERGTQLDPDNHLAHYFYAGAIQGGNRVISESDLRLARAELRKSIELAPQFVAATEQLANLNLVTDNDMPQTIDLLRKARAFAPGNDNLTVMLAFALRIPDPEEARSLALSVLKKHSITPAMRKNAETVLSAVAQMSAHRQAPPTTATREVSARINGKLTAIDCTEDSITLVLLVDGQAARQSGTLSEVRFAAPVGCGPLSGGGTPVLLHYQPEGSSGDGGELDVEAPGLTPINTLP